MNLFGTLKENENVTILHKYIRSVKRFIFAAIGHERV
jgi:hypothetical protein